MVSGIDWIWVLRGALLSQPLQHHPSVSSHLANRKHLLKNIHFSHVAFLAPSSSPLRTRNAHSHPTYPPVYELGSPSSGRCILCLKSKGLSVWAGRLQGILFSSSSWSRHSSPSGRNHDDGLFCALLTRIPSDKGLNNLPENSGSQSFIPSQNKFSIGCSNCEQLNNVCLKVSPLCWAKALLSRGFARYLSFPVLTWDCGDTGVRHERHLWSDRSCLDLVWWRDGDSLRRAGTSILTENGR